MRLIWTTIFIASISISANLSHAAEVKIVSSEDISAKISSVGGVAKSVYISGISRDGAIVVGRFKVDKPTSGFKLFRYVANLNKFEILNSVFEKSMIPDHIDIWERISNILISADGNVIAGSYWVNNELGNHVFVYSDSKGFKDIGDFGLGKAIIELNGVSADGSVLVGAFSPVLPAINWQAFKYSEDKGFVNLQGMGKEHAFANGVSSDGSIIVGNYRNSDDADHSFRYSSIDGVVDIASIGKIAAANCVSDNGSVITGTYLGGFNFLTFSSYARAYIYTQKDGVKELGAMSFLGDSAVPLSISANGDYFNGVYVDYSGNSHIFRATISE